MATKKTVITEKTKRNLVNGIVKSVDNSSKRAEKQSKEWGVIRVETSPLISSLNYVSREAFDEHIAEYSYSKTQAEKYTYRVDKDMLSRTQYQGWLVSPVLWKRSLAIYGHALLAHIVFAGVVGLIVLLVNA